MLGAEFLFLMSLKGNWRRDTEFKLVDFMGFCGNEDLDSPWISPVSIGLGKIDLGVPLRSDVLRAYER